MAMPSLTHPPPSAADAAAAKATAKLMAAVTAGVQAASKAAAKAAHAKVAGTSQAAAKPKRPTDRCAALGRLLWRWQSPFAFAIVLVALVIIGNATVLREAGRFLVIVNDAFAGASLAVATAAIGAANATSDLASIGVDVASSSVSLARNFWQGVELGNLVVDRRHGRTFVSDPNDVGIWLSNLSEPSLVPRAVADFALITANISDQRPLQDVSGALLQLTGVYDDWRGTARMTQLGCIGFSFQTIHITYVPKWCNPMWEALELPLHTANAQTLRILRSVSAELEPVPSTALDLSDKALLQTGVAPRSRSARQTVS